ncbi:thiamine pyrophosphate-binding protein [Paraburkholderia antibiotica]|uniref:Thiamine pyrophosphate-binding protein n=1 Tax=Paraburkholderia antibiotica TaxID=2728839 RepID=A0A7X9X6H7_9BURK|nr:thiamine pyrophosphate-binding protein [Paraburkholderia antibiotica]NML32295.1 thiamine pyrophosphate-binding protein [Paraburkholderia antibiotica]
MEQSAQNAAQAGIGALRKAGVTAVFGNPGTTELPLMQALSGQPEMHYYLGLQEGVSVGMAAGYAAASGKPGVVMLHAVPGVSNGLSHYYNAFRNGLPVLMISGQSDRAHQYLSPMLYGNLETATAAYSKWTWEARTAEEIPVVMVRAFSEAAAAPSGPTFLSLPLDLQLQPVESSDGHVFAQPRLGAAAASDIAECAHLLRRATNPAIVAGDLIGRNRCEADLVQLATNAGCAVYWEPMSLFANFPADNPAFQGVLFPSGEDFRRVFRDHDVVLWCGSDLRAPLLYDGTLWHDASTDVIVLSDRTAGISDGFAPALLLVGDPAATLQEIGGELGLAGFDADAAHVRERRERLANAAAARRAKITAAAQKRAAQVPLAPVSVIDEILTALPRNAIVVDDAVSNSGWVSMCGQYGDAISYLGPSKGGGIGFGLPVALGAKVAQPERPVVAFLGDGAAMYSIQGLWSAAHHDLPVVFVILNNSSYRILKGGILTMFGDTHDADALATVPGFDLNTPAIDFVALARSCGVAARRIDSPGQCADAMREALASGKPYLLDIGVERDVRKVLR